MNRRLFDIAVLTAELQAKIAINDFEKKFQPKEKEQNAENQTPRVAENNPAETQYQ